jgi:hypothetical protein
MITPTSAVVPLEVPQLFDLERTFETADNWTGPIATYLRWFRLEDLVEVSLQPEFPKTALLSLPLVSQHIVQAEVRS